MDQNNTETVERVIKAPYFQLFILILGTFMAVLDTSIVNVAIPKMEPALNSNINQIQWVLTAYMLVSGITIPITSWLSNKLGTKNLFTYSLALFTIGSTLCGIASNLPAMILFRIIQALGGGFLMPLANTLIYKIFPPKKRGGVMGVFGLAIMLAPAFGPLLSGYFVQYLSWRFIFFINIPFGIIGTILSFIIIQNFPDGSAEKLDVWGFFLSTTGLFSLLYGLTNVSTDGWNSLSVYPFLIVGGVLLIFLVAVELMIDKPLIEFRVFKDYLFTLSVIITSLIQITIFVSLFLLPLFFENIMAFTPLKIGEFMTPAALLSAPIMMLGGLLLNKIGARLIAVTGLIMTVVATYGFCFLNVNSTENHMQFLYIFRMVGATMALMPIMTAGMNRLSHRLLSQASGLSNTIRQVASSLGIAVFTYYFEKQIAVHEHQMISRLTLFSPQGIQFNVIQSKLIYHGLSPIQAHLTALTILNEAVNQHAFVAALNDTFLVGTILSAVCLVVTFFFNDKQYSVDREDQHAILLME